MKEETFWSISEETLLTQLQSTSRGLSSEQVVTRLKEFGSNTLSAAQDHSHLRDLLNQFRSPISILLIVAAFLSLLVGEHIDGAIVLGILILSAGLSYWEERRANDAIEKLLKKLESRAVVRRDGENKELPSAGLVPGDVILLSAGSNIPADARILEAKDLFVDESTLTGESYPAEKEARVCAPDCELGKRCNALFFGTHIISGTATAIVVNTGENTIYGKIAGDLRRRQPPTEFEHGVNRFGYLLLEVAVVMSLVVFAINVWLERPVLDALLFTLALTVGLTPQLLPAIVTSTLAHGAHRMALKDAIVRRLTAIADLGGINVLCTDKTGTITEGVMRWERAVDARGESSSKVRLFGYLNALHETGFRNPIDDAMRSAPVQGADDFLKLDEVPYDFNRRRLSVLLRRDKECFMVTKGAVKEMLDVCSLVEIDDRSTVELHEVLPQLQATFDSLSKKGMRCLAVAYRRLQEGHVLRKDSESEMTFLGFLVFSDPIKEGVIESLDQIRKLGITCKVVTGDNKYVAQSVISKLGIDQEALLTGSDLRKLNEKALVQKVHSINLFAEVDPNQKSRIILALRKAGFAVGYLGDGINDATALHDADVGISVDTAVDVTKEAADIVLLRKELQILAEAIREGRRAFANTLKYVFINTSASFGNMFSMAGLSLFTTFLPFLPKQVLLLNILSDLPAMAIASDDADPELVDHPRRWDARRIAWFMAVYGIISSVFDYLTFAALFISAVPLSVFRTGWFIESLISELLILLVIRTRRFFFQSKVGRGLLWLTAIIVMFAIILPYSLLGSTFGLSPIPFWLVLIIAAIIGAYVATAEVAKRLLPRLLD